MKQTIKKLKQNKNKQIRFSRDMICDHSAVPMRTQSKNKQTA